LITSGLVVARPRGPRLELEPAALGKRDRAEIVPEGHRPHLARLATHTFTGASLALAPEKPPVKKAPAAKPAQAPAAPAAPAPAPGTVIKPRDDGKPVQVPSKCVYCTICAKKCPAGALEVDRAAKTWTLDEDLCVACGTCAGVCPKKAIVI
jgi:ferredoxin